MRQFRLLGLGTALALSGLAGHLNAQCPVAAGAVKYSSSGGLAVSGTASPAASTINVPATGVVGSLCVDLTGVTASGQGGSQSMLFATLLLTSPGATNGLVLLSATGDGIDGDDTGASGSGLSGLNISVSDAALFPAPCANQAACNGSAAPAVWPHSGAVSVQPGSYWREAHGSGPPLGVAGNWPQTDSNATFASAIDGAVAAGAWMLTLVDTNGDPVVS